jgi:hypothetical protein
MYIDYNKHIWEGWLVRDFIDELESSINSAILNSGHIKKINNKKELKEFCMDNQPYYKKYIPEVVNHFAQQYKLK